MSALNHAAQAPRLRWLICLAGMLVLLAAPKQASAQASTKVSCTGAAQTVVIPMPTSLNLSNDAAVGTLLTNVVVTPPTRYFQCSGSSVSVAVGVMPSASLVKATTVFGIPLTVSVNGTLLSVFNTNIPGIGIALGVKILLGCSVLTFFQDAGQILSGAFPTPWIGQSCGIANTSADGVQVEAVLVKTGTTSAGTVTAGSVLQAASFVGANLLPILVMQTGSGAPGLISFVLSPVRAPVPSCLTPDVTVSMGTYSVSSFKGAGSVSPAVPFNLAFNGCTPGLTQIQFQLSAPNGLATSATNVINLSSDSTARGIGVQIENSNGLPIVLNTTYNIVGVNGTTGSYTIPFKAAYYQTGANVTAGTANANLTFTVNYQ